MGVWGSALLGPRCLTSVSLVAFRYSFGAACYTVAGSAPERTSLAGGVSSASKAEVVGGIVHHTADLSGSPASLESEEKTRRRFPCRPVLWISSSHHRHSGHIVQRDHALLLCCLACLLPRRKKATSVMKAAQGGLSAVSGAPGKNLSPPGGATGDPAVLVL